MIQDNKIKVEKKVRPKEKLALLAKNCPDMFL